MKENFKIVPSKRGETPSHCSSMMRKIQKVNELSSLFVSLEKCTKNLKKFLVAVWDLIRVLFIIVLGIIYILSVLSAL